MFPAVYRCQTSDKEKNGITNKCLRRQYHSVILHTTSSSFTYSGFPFLRRLPHPFGLQHRQERHWPSPRGLRTGQRRPVRVGVSPAHVGPRGASPAQDRGGSIQAAIPSPHRPLLRARVQSAGGQDQRLVEMDVE